MSREPNLGDMLGILSASADMILHPPPIIGRTVIEIDDGEVTVSTVDSTDMGLETAIICQAGTRIAARYGSRKEAEQGHERILESLRGGQRDFEDQGYGDALDPFPFTVEALPKRSEEEGS